MLPILLLGGFGFVCVLIVVFVLLMKGKKRNQPGTATDATRGDSLKDELPGVLAIVKGEKATDVVASGYFQGVYPGVAIATNRAAVPKTQPAFLLLTDPAGTITGVEANSVLWDSGDSVVAAPVPVPAKPVTPQQKQGKK